MPASHCQFSDLIDFMEIDSAKLNLRQVYFLIKANYADMLNIKKP